MSDNQEQQARLIDEAFSHLKEQAEALGKAAAESSCIVSNPFQDGVLRAFWERGAS